MRNFVCFGGRFKISYVYIDSHNYLADSLFYKYEVPVKFGDEMSKNGEDYRLIFCKIKRKYKEKFEKALEELNNKMLLCGYEGYEEFCNKLIDWIESNEKQT